MQATSELTSVGAIPIRFDQFYRYEELTQLLHDFAATYPNLVRIRSIGRSYKGRDIWLLTVTNFASGSDREKPALWVDGNIHSVELAASTACLYLLHTLVNGYGTDPEISRCLDGRVFYICPRVNPDGAEWALADQPKHVRSSIRPYPVRLHDLPVDGLVQQDVDGDGRILHMRIPDPSGAWKVCPDDPRLMVRRDPVETGGTYYRIFPEGIVENYDGALINLQPNREQLDLNRNFPAQWRPEHEQPGAGDYPTSEPEAQALVQFVTEHPNITGAIAFHTYGGLLLRPFSYRADEELDTQDLRVYNQIGQKGTELTQYPAVSIYHKFRPDKDVATGAFDDWMYEHQGVFAWTVEIWSPPQQAGLRDIDLVAWRQDHPVEDDLKMMRWVDQELGGEGYVDWYPFEHPQLGTIELGGWDWIRTWANPPASHLEREVALFPKWLVWHLLISPKLELWQAEAQCLGDDIYAVRLVVQNTGWLPSYVTQQAKQRKIVQGCRAEIHLPAAAKLLSGKPSIDLGQLEGRAYKRPLPYADVTDDRAKAEWIVQAPPGTQISLTAQHDRAGTVRATVTCLPANDIT